MVLLSTFGALMGVGFIAWALGYVIKRPEVSVIGVVMILGAGGLVLTGGLTVVDGERVTTEQTTTFVADEDITGAPHVATLDVSTEDNSPTGFDFLNTGSRLYISGASTATIYEYTTSSFDLTLATLAANYSVSSEDSDPRGVDMADNGAVMIVTGGATSTIYQYDLSTPGEVDTASLSSSLDVSGQTTEARAAVISRMEGTDLFVLGEANSEIYYYTLSSPFDLSTATFEASLDISSLEATPTGIDFSSDGRRMLVVGESADTVFEYDLGSAYDIQTAQYNGERLGVGAQANQPSGVEFADEERRIFISDLQGATLEQYDNQRNETIEETNKVDTYREVDGLTSFPLGFMIMILGGVGILASFEKFNELA